MKKVLITAIAVCFMKTAARGQIINSDQPGQCYSTNTLAADEIVLQINSSGILNKDLKAPQTAGITLRSGNMHIETFASMQYSINAITNNTELTAGMRKHLHPDAAKWQSTLLIMGYVNTITKNSYTPRIANSSAYAITKKLNIHAMVDISIPAFKSSMQYQNLAAGLDYNTNKFKIFAQYFNYRNNYLPAFINVESTNNISIGLAYWPNKYSQIDAYTVHDTKNWVNSLFLGYSIRLAK